MPHNDLHEGVAPAPQTSINKPTAAWLERLNRIELNGAIISRSQADNVPILWQKGLQTAYINKTPPRCMCNPSEPVAMYIARMGDTYILKRRPKTGHLHHAECESHGGISRAANELYTDDAIYERPDGKIVHTLSVPMSTIEHVMDTLDEIAAPPRPLQNTEKRPVMTLRGFMNLLWEESGLASWSPGMIGKRTLTRVYWRLKNELIDRQIGATDAQIRVYVPSGHLGENAERATRLEIEQRFAQLEEIDGPNKKPILLIVGELRSIKPTSRDTLLRLKGLPDSMPIWTSPMSIERLRHQWPATMARFDKSPQATALTPGTPPPPDTGNRVIVLAGVQMTQQGNLMWRFGSAMETVGDFIPVESQFEARIANALIAQGRAFNKPMLYDAAEATFPDFLLTDLGNTPVPMEIYGYSGPEYEARKCRKVESYRQSGKLYWDWDVSRIKIPPAFPRSESTQ